MSGSPLSFPSVCMVLFSAMLFFAPSHALACGKPMQSLINDAQGVSYGVYSGLSRRGEQSYMKFNVGTVIKGDIPNVVYVPVSSASSLRKGSTYLLLGRQVEKVTGGTIIHPVGCQGIRDFTRISRSDIIALEESFSATSLAMKKARKEKQEQASAKATQH